MRGAHHQELDALLHGPVEMARLVGSAMGRATTAMLEADLQPAEGVISADGRIDHLQRDLEDRAIAVLASAATGRDRPARGGDLAADARRSGSCG